MDITPAARNNRHLVVFHVAPYGFCSPATEVYGIITVPHVRPLPHAPPSVIGLANHRGEVYRVISLRRKLGLEAGPPRVEGQLILTRLPSGRAAFLVDEVVDVLPAERLVWRRLSPHSPMDFFDAFLVRDGQILFHSSFARMEQAGETPYPSPDLADLKSKAAAAVPPPSPRETSPPPATEETRNHEEARSRATRTTAPLKQEALQV